ncbi:MAG: MFS transporter [Pseudomonadota bacterium]
MNESFTSYQKVVVGLLAFLQFTVVLDFMVLAPLGPLLIEGLRITTSQFGLLVSAYAFSAATSGLLAAGFADRFDRRRLLLTFYVGFILGTALCAVATTYLALLTARLITGFFGGVVGSIIFAILADLIPLSMRGRAMGFVQTAFAASQVLGIPIGLSLATRWGVNAAFVLVVALAVLAATVIALKLQPVVGHLRGANAGRSPVAHLARTATRPRYVAGFSATMLLATGGFMLMPFGSTFLVQNLHVSMAQLPVVYAVTGVTSILAGPVLGRASDSFGKYRTFAASSAVGTVLVVLYTGLTAANLGLVLGLNVALFLCISARMVAASALTSALPAPADRGAYMSISSSLQQLAGGVAGWVAGLLIHQAKPTSPLENYARLGWIVAAAMVIATGLMFNVSRLITLEMARQRPLGEKSL